LPLLRLECILPLCKKEFCDIITILLNMEKYFADKRSKRGEIAEKPLPDCEEFVLEMNRKGRILEINYS